MNSERILAYLGRITYKPGWLLRCEVWGPTEVLFRVEWTAPCAVTGRPNIQVTSQHILRGELLRSEDDILKSVLWALKRAEEHETLEFLKVDGIAPFDPHRTN